MGTAVPLHDRDRLGISNVEYAVCTTPFARPTSAEVCDIRVPNQISKLLLRI